MSMGDLGSATFRVAADTNPFEAGMKRAQAQAARTTQVISAELGNAATAATTKLGAVGREVEKTAGKMKQGLSNRGLGLMAVGQMVDDMQYGFRSIVNNIPQVVYMMGGSGGLAGGAAIAAVAINQIVERWGAMTDAMQSSWLNVPAERLEQLRIRAEKAAEAFEKLMQSPSKFETKQINALTEAMTEGGPGGARAVFKGVAEAISQEPGLRAQLDVADQAELDRKRKLARQFPNDPMMQQNILRHEAEAKALLMEQNRQKAKDLMGKAILPGEEGAEARATLRRLIEKFPGAFSAEFIKAMKKVTDVAVEHADVNKSTAGRLMKGPMGARMIAGEGDTRLFGGGTPMDEKEMLALLRDTKHHIRLGPGEEAGILNKMKDAKLSAEEGRQIMAGMRTKDVQAFAKEHGVQIWQAVPQMFQERLNEVVGRRGKEMPNAMDAPIRKFLKDAGIHGDAEGVRREMQAITKERIQDVMAEHGLDKEDARSLLLRQRAAQLGAARGGQYVGIAQFAKMSPEHQMPELAKSQLTELQAIRQILNKQDQRRQTENAGAMVAMAAMPG